MRTHSRNLFVAGLSLALFPLLAAPALAGEQEVKAIENRLQQYESRFNESDAAAVSRLFDKDVVYYGPTGQVFEGREAVRQRYQRSLSAGFSDMAIETVEIRVFGDTAYDVARYTVSDPSGEPLSGYHLAILAKENGEWIVQRTLVNAVMPVPPGE